VKFVTVLPTDSTVPENSMPAVWIFVGRQSPLESLATKGSAFRILQSTAATVVGPTRTRDFVVLRNRFRNILDLNNFGRDSIG
jgi:hypothetical protein